MKKAAILIMTFVLLFSSLAVLGGVRAQTRAVQDDTLHIYAMTHVNQYESDLQYITIQYNQLNFSLRPVVLSSNGTYVVSSTDTKPFTVTVTNDTVKLSGASGAVIVTMNFYVETDAENDKYIYITFEATASNTTEYNTLTLLFYSDDYTNFIYNTLNDDWYDYYGVASSVETWHAFRKNDGSGWLLVETNAGKYYSESYHAVTGNINAREAGFSFAPVGISGWAAVKFKEVNKAPQTSWKILDFVPYSNTSLFSIYDNESIFKEAKEYGYNAVLIHDQWMVPATYDALNKTAILDIANYANKYGMKFGLYFGWRDFAIKAYDVLSYSDTNVTAMENAWHNFTAKWDNLVDFYYFDYSNFREYGNDWSGENWKLLTQIWANTTKTIIYNGPGVWYVGGRFIPLPFETASIDTFDTYYSKVPTADPFVHAMNYPSIPFTKTFYDSSTYTYNNTLAERYINYYYEWGMIPITLYAFKYPVNQGFPDFVNDFKDWKSGMYVYHDITGTVGVRNVQLENSHEIRLLLTDTESQITVTPHIAKLPVRIYTNKTVTIEYEINPSPSIAVKDLTTGQTVNWRKGSVIFTAQAGHTYEIEDVIKQSINDAYSIIPVMFTFIIIILFITIIGKLVKMASRPIRS